MTEAWPARPVRRRTEPHPWLSRSPWARQSAPSSISKGTELHAASLELHSRPNGHPHSPRLLPRSCTVTQSRAASSA
ncbi:hypothetical protein A2U01_0089962 [Trifolium medium]|uniref:Uncharacterized protein n=1 Tax=Trifolium medium TaxID=97028 RepID=A0A392U5E6_9FABA|nr:hypothetical protein [Trifolium medium]